MIPSDWEDSSGDENNDDNGPAIENLAPNMEQGPINIKDRLLRIGFDHNPTHAILKDYLKLLRDLGHDVIKIKCYYN